MPRLTNHLLALFCLFAVALVPSATNAQSACHLLTSANPVPEDFGAAYNLFSSAKDLLLRVECSPSKVTLQVGNAQDPLYIYKTAYEWTGSNWRQLALSGQNRVGDWYVGSAATNLLSSEAQLSQQNFLVAYTCARDGSQWKCGCRNTSCSTNHWQLQAYTYALPPTPPSPPLLADPGDDDDERGGSANALAQQYPDLYDENLPYNGLIYGFPFSHDKFYLLRIGGSEYGNRSLRFRAERSGSVAYVRIQNRWDAAGRGYSTGNGGRIRAELRSDDGTPEHHPSGTILARTNSYVPRQHGNGGSSWIQLNFSQPATIQSHKLYHIVLVQEERDYASTNGAAINVGFDHVFGPYWGNDNLILMSPGAAWSFVIAGRKKGYGQSYVSIGYSDGVEVGTGGWGYARNHAVIGGSSRVREIFKVSGPTRRANGVWFRVPRKAGNTAPLIVEIKNGSGHVILSKSVPASRFSEGSTNGSGSKPVMWVHLDFGTVVPFQSGSTYSIELSSPSSGGYGMHASLDVNAWYGLKDRNMWTDGRGEVSSNGGKSWTDKIGTDAGRIDFGFAFTLEGGPRSIQSIAAFEKIR